MMNSEIKCPQCKKSVSWKENPDRPFCSERCRLLDLGQWADESYRVAGPSQEEWTDDNVISINENKHLKGHN